MREAVYKGGGADTTRGLSSRIWADAPSFQEAAFDPSNRAIWFFDEFMEFPFTVPTTEANFGRYKGFSSTGGLLNDNDERGGVLKLGSDDDNEGSSIATVSLPFQLDRDLGKLWFEARVKTSTITDTKHGIFVGLIDSCTLSATVPIAAAGTLADENFVGFHRLEGDGDYFDTVYRANGVTQVTVGANAVNIAADTYVKLGMIFDPKDNYLRFYANGVELADKKEIPAADGTDFPNDVRLGLVMAVLNATGTTPGTAAIDWWACCQRMP